MTNSWKSYFGHGKRYSIYVASRNKQYETSIDSGGHLQSIDISDNDWKEKVTLQIFEHSRR